MKFLQNNFKSRSSARRHRIEIWRVIRTNDRGYVEDKSQRIATVWASVEPISERLRVQYQTVSVAASHSITVDGSVAVLEADKIKFGERWFDILTVKQVDEGKRDKIIITQEIRQR